MESWRSVEEEEASVVWRLTAYTAGASRVRRIPSMTMTAVSSMRVKAREDFMGEGAADKSTLAYFLG
jgi:hypothetical protein